MNFMAGRVAAVMVLTGVALGGCASIDSLRDAQESADLADSHAASARARADEAYGVGNHALAIGNNALGSAQQANQKADMAASDISDLKRRVGDLEDKNLPHHKKKVRHRRAATSVEPKNS